jgi:hypothetical protein
MLIIAWHIIQYGTVYEELGGNHHDRLHPDRSARRLIKRLEQIGFQVTVKKAILESAPTADDTSSKPKEAVSKNRAAVKSRSATADTAPQRTFAKPADPNLCRRCARWGIPCIRVRNAKITPPTYNSFRHNFNTLGGCFRRKEGKRSSIVNKGQQRSWRSTQCIEIHGVSSGLVETRLNALIAFPRQCRK